ncbi:MAG: hypothetical protein ABIB43_02910 [archaeon]
MRSILSLSEYVKRLPKKKREIFLRLFSISDSIGKSVVPEEMKPWITKTFGSVKAVETQKIVRIDNNITCVTALFNELRAKRPIDAKNKSNAKEVIKENKGKDFCNPLTHTTEDYFGRIKGKKSITASNVAKYGAFHGVIIFKEHDPLKFNAADVKDHLETAEKWIEKVHEKHPLRIYPFILWNCLWKAGASIVHGHMQVLIGRSKHYGEIERLRRFASGYGRVYGSDYFKDLYESHKSVGLGFEQKNNRIMAHLTPRKEKEVIIMAKTLNNASEALYKALNAYRKMGVESFNVGIYLQPLDGSWKMPVIIRIVDRGSLANNTTDIAGMELFAGASVVASDPYKVIEKIKKEF